MIENNLNRAIQELLDGVISVADLELLQQELETSERARELYIDSAEIHSILTQTEEAVAHLPTNIVPMERIMRRQGRKTLRIVALSTAAILLIGLISMQLFFISSPEPALVFETSPGTQYSLTHRTSEQPPKSLVLEKGSRLQLAQGTVELTFKSGVTSVITAPADLTLRDDDLIFLNKGTAWFHVPKEAIGFTVKTNDLDIVDLGTEFGVLTKDNHHDEVHVFKGKVRASALRHRKESVTLSAGQASRIDSIGRLTTIPTKASAFLTSLPDSLPYIRWSFDEEVGFQATGTHVAVADINTTAKASPSLVPGKHGNALYLNGQSQQLITNWEGFSGNRARTVTCWLRLPADNNLNKRFQGIVGWGLWGGDRSKWKITVNQDSPSAPTLIRCSLGNAWIDGSTQLADNKWHHIAITTSGQPDAQGKLNLQLYVDGHLEVMKYTANEISADGKFDLLTDTSHRRSVPLLIGTTIQHNLKQRQTLKGAIDELMIFDGHMTAKEIKQTMTP